jgi:hypothetical protein
MSRLDDVSDSVMSRLKDLERRTQLGDSKRAELGLMRVEREELGFNRKEFGELLYEVGIQRLTLTSAEIDSIFRVYDDDSNGILTRADLQRFLCDQHSGGGDLH